MRLHVFGYSSDLERADILFTSLLVQMARALAGQPVPGTGGEARAWRRSWMLGYCSAVVTRVRAAEEAAVASAASAGTEATAADGQRAALVLADRSLVVRRQVAAAYPRLRKARVTYSGNGYGAGYREGQRADIGGAKLRSRPAGARPLTVAVRYRSSIPNGCVPSPLRRASQRPGPMTALQPRRRRHPAATSPAHPSADPVRHAVEA